jgi:C_GCAxxG_C_C family probable redox protein
MEEALRMESQLPNEDVLNELDRKVWDNLALSGNCAQTSFVSLQQQFGLDGSTITKALTAFPGVALRGETCGAVTGSLMALGLLYGRERLDDAAGFTAALRVARRFCRQFEKELGSTMCGDILESEFGKRYNLADPAESAEWMAACALEKCSVVVSKGVRIAAGLIMDET